MVETWPLTQIDPMFGIFTANKMEYMQSKFTRFSPADVTDKGSKIIKRPVIKGWLDVTEEQSAELARHPDYRTLHVPHR